MMSQPTITIEAPFGLGRRSAIEWCVEHLIRALDRLDQAEDAARDYDADPVPICAPSQLHNWAWEDHLTRWDDPDGELTTLISQTRPALLTIILGG